MEVTTTSITFYGGSAVMVGLLCFMWLIVGIVLLMCLALYIIEKSYNRFKLTPHKLAMMNRFIGLYYRLNKKGKFQ